MDDVISEEVLGVVHDEHYEPRKKQRFTPVTVRAERSEYKDRTFYILRVQGGGDYASADLDRAGWEQVRALCDAVLKRMDQP